MCWADTGVILQEIDREGRLHYDFSTQHYCQDFEKVKSWTEGNAVVDIQMQNLWWSGGDAV